MKKLSALLGITVIAMFASSAFAADLTANQVKEGIVGEWKLLSFERDGKLIDDKINQMLKENPLRLEFYDKYKEIITEYNKGKKTYGAKVILTPKEGGMKGSITKAEEISKEKGKVFIPQQFKNLANPEIHRVTTAKEIFNDLEGQVDGFVAGIGTGGTITGVGEVLKDRVGARMKIYAVEPKKSAILSGGEAGPHKIQGIGAGFIPDVLNTEIYDKIITVDYEDAVETARKLAKLEGIFVGISAGACAWATIYEASKDFEEGENLVALLPDGGEKYLSTDLFRF